VILMMQSEQLAKELTTIADDEWIIGSFLAEMAGGGPFVEENVAISSIAQDEIGHAELLYNEVLKINLSLQWNDADGFVYTRSASEFRPSALVTSKNTEWAMICTQHYLYECADRHRIRKLIPLVDGNVKDALRQILREENYHQRHWETWVKKMTVTSDGKRRLQESIQTLWPKFLAVFTETFLENDVELFSSVEKELTSLGYDIPVVHKPDFPRNVLSTDVKRLIKESRSLTEGEVATKW
jgi:ring-1,2-phenylacetyl-CoA epoxidase subunit PaaC